MKRSKTEGILNKIAENFGQTLTKFSPLTGGDINQVYLLECGSEKFVVKLNDSSRFPGMFEAEKRGLQELANANTIDVPEALNCGIINQQSYLLLEYKSSAPKISSFWETFGEQLAFLHQKTSDSFGFEKDNYIGIQFHPEKSGESGLKLLDGYLD